MFRCKAIPVDDGFIWARELSFHDVEELQASDSSDAKKLAMACLASAMVQEPNDPAPVGAKEFQVTNSSEHNLPKEIVLRARYNSMEEVSLESFRLVKLYGDAAIEVSGLSEEDAAGN